MLLLAYVGSEIGSETSVRNRLVSEHKLWTARKPGSQIARFMSKPSRSWGAGGLLAAQAIDEAIYLSDAGETSIGGVQTVRLC
jgi:hypothetical protein